MELAGPGFQAPLTPDANDIEVPVVLLTGFLGAGKTSLLEHLLLADHGWRLGIVVNDIAALNVDAAVLDSAVRRTSTRSIQLSNGCVCCTASDDLRVSVQELLRPPTEGPVLDAIVVELSGVSEPKAVRENLKQVSAGDDSTGYACAKVARTIALVDTPAFAADFVAQLSTPGTPGHKDGTERLSALLAEQVEDADLILLNKSDIASDMQKLQAEAVVRSLNNSADLLSAEHGRVAPHVVLPTLTLPASGRRHDDAIAREEATATGHGDDGHGHGHDDGGHGHGRDDAKHGHNHADQRDEPSHAERRFGIRSFVFSATRPLSRFRFISVLQQWQAAWQAQGHLLELKEHDVDVSGSREPSLSKTADTKASPLAPVLRSKGMLWMDSQPGDAMYWSHAGRSACFSNWGVWSDFNDAPLHATAGTRSLRQQAPIITGPPRTELVFIGSGVDELAVRDLLESCVLTEEEFARIPGMANRMRDADGMRRAS